MASRLELQEMLCNILGSKNVYFQPPSSTQMKYPAIRYSISKIQNTFADNTVYGQTKVYQLMVIDKNPESLIVDAISKLPTCEFVRSYTADNLNHTIFTIHY